MENSKVCEMLSGVQADIMQIVEKHNQTVDYISHCDVRINNDDIFKAMGIWHKLACEAFEIVSVAHKYGLTNLEANMLAGEIVGYDRHK